MSDRYWARLSKIRIIVELTWNGICYRYGQQTYYALQQACKPREWMQLNPFLEFDCKWRLNFQALLVFRLWQSLQWPRLASGSFQGQVLLWVHLISQRVDHRLDRFYKIDILLPKPYLILNRFNLEEYREGTFLPKIDRKLTFMRKNKRISFDCINSISFWFRTRLAIKRNVK